MGISSYRDLVAWRKGVELATQSYEVTRTFPREELFGLTSQIRRAAAAGPANIAEGQGRETTGAFVQFLRVAKGSLKELETHVIVSKRVGLMSTARQEEILSRCDEL